MSLFDWLNKSRRANEALAASIQENNVRLAEVAVALNARESPERIREAIHAGFQNCALEKALGSTCERVDVLNSSLRDSSSRPIPVQTFPLVDDFRFENQKKQVAAYAAHCFVQVGEEFSRKLADAHVPVGQAMERFFAILDKIKETNANEPKKDLAVALDTLMHCSPKRIVATFQQRALEAGWALVSQHNLVIDALASQFPRCRAGIYASRLNYADVIQVSEEILSTLRASSTLLDDAQRRHDLLEALGGELLRDLKTPEIQMIWNAAFDSVSSSINLASKEDGVFKKFFKTVTAGVTIAPLVAVSAALAVPTAQFQGHLAREHRFKAFLATSVMLNQVWTDWSRVNEAIVLPHLKIMFRLKSDYISNKMICVCDLLTTNGYSLEQLSSSRLLGERAKD